MPKASRNAVCFGISFPQSILDKIDADRGDVPRSKYILRLVEEVYAHREQARKK